MKQAPSRKAVWILIPLIIVASITTMVIVNTPKEEFFSGWSDYDTLPGLCGASDFIVVAEIKTFPSENSQIAQMTVEQVVKGNIQAGDLLKVKIPESIRLEASVRYLLFLRGPKNASLNLPYTLVNSTQGIYPVVENTVTLPESNSVFGSHNNLEEILELIRRNLTGNML